MNEEANPEIISAGSEGGEQQSSQPRVNYPNAKPQPKAPEAPPQEQPKENPSWKESVPEKFRRDTPEETLAALSKSYTELEKMKSGAKPDTKTENLEIPEEQQASEESTEAEGLSKADNAKVWSTVEQELNSNGLSEETVEQLTKDYEIPPTLLKQLNSLVTENRAARTQQAASIVGGEENLTGLINWASQNLKPEERATINAQLAGPGWQTTLLGLQAMYSRQNPETPQKPGDTVLEPSGSGASGVRPFADMREMTDFQRQKPYRDARHPDHNKVKREFLQRMALSQKQGTI